MAKQRLVNVTRFNKGNRYTQGLSFAWTSSGSNLGPGDNSGVALGPTDLGQAAILTATDGEIISFNSRAELSGAINASTMFLAVVRSRGYVNQGSSFNTLFSKDTEWQLRVSATQWGVNMYDTVSLDFGDPTDGDWHVIMGLSSDRPAATERQGVIYDGIAQTTSSGGIYTPTASAFEIGTSDVTRNADADVALILYWNRGWWDYDSDTAMVSVTAQLQDLIRDPWQVFERKKIFVPLTKASPIIEEIGGTPGIVTGDITFSTQLDKVNTKLLTAGVVSTFLTNLTETSNSVKTTSDSSSFGVNLSETDTNTATRSVTFTASIDLNQLEANTADRAIEYLQDLSLNQASSNIKTSEGIITFTTDLTYDLLVQLAASLNITLGATLDTQQEAGGTGIITAAITFLSSMQQNESNVITADKAATLLMSLNEQHDNQLDKFDALSLSIQASDSYLSTRDIPGNIDFNTELGNTQDNTALRVGLMTFDSILNKGIGTAGSSFGAVINFASSLAAQFGTEGDISDSISYSIGMNQSTPTPVKNTDAALGFDIQANIVKEIHLVVDGQISLSTTMDQTEFKQLTGQSQITFGHLQGLASLGSADLGANISFSTIQNVSVQGFVLQFEILTPDERVYKIYVEDRTNTIDDETRISIINKT